MIKKNLRSTILEIGRRQAKLLIDTRIEDILIERKHARLVPGDLIEVDDLNQITEVIERKNILSRASSQRVKEIAANIDILLLVTAPEPLYNTNVIDRVLLRANEQEIPVLLIMNKKDLKHDDIQHCLDYYNMIGIDVIKTQAEDLDKSDCRELLEYLKAFSGQNIGLAGVSGVGKSSILKKLINNEDIFTYEVSERTGQGRQTTSRVTGYPFLSDKILFDVPGIQNFGIADLTYEEIKLHFPDFVTASSNCEYKSCLHLEEDDCGVKIALSEGDVLFSRYESYYKIMLEIEAAKRF